MSISTIFKRSLGINNRLPPHRIEVDADSGGIAFQRIVNFDIDESGGLSTRPAHEMVSDGFWQSLHSTGARGFGVRNDELRYFYVEGDGSLSSKVIEGGVGHSLSFCSVNDTTFFTSRSLFGKIENNIFVPWVAGQYVGPPTDKSFSPPFAADLVTFYAGRTVLALDNFIAFSEPFAFSWFDLHGSSIVLDSAITAWKPIETGMFISTETAVYFLEGKSPESFSLRVVHDFPIIRGCVAPGRVDLALAGFQDGGRGVAFLARDGVCIGSPSGEVVNVTRMRVEQPSSLLWGGAALDRIFFLSSGAKGALFDYTADRYSEDKYVLDSEEDGYVQRTSLRGGIASHYSNFPFISFCEVNGTFYAGGPDGLFVEKAGDVPGQLLETPMVDWGVTVEKRPRFCYITFSGGPLIFYAKNSQGHETCRMKIFSDRAGEMDTVKVPMPRCASDRHWAFCIEDCNGAPMKIDALEVFWTVRPRGAKR